MKLNLDCNKEFSRKIWNDLKKNEIMAIIIYKLKI